MTDTELIARQAKLIAELQEENDRLTTAIGNAASRIYGIGGPLNDSRIEYSKEQLVPFSQIVKDLGY